MNAPNSVSVVTESDCCHVLSTTDENNKTTYYDYDDAGRLTKTWTSLSGQSANAPLVQNEYDEFGAVWRVTTRSDAGTTRQTSYTFDKLGRVTAVDNPGPLGDEAYGYDDYGNQLWKQDGKGAYTLYKYDSMNRVINAYYNYTGGFDPIVYPQNSDVSYTFYGGSGLMANVVDSAGTSKYAYNLLRQMSAYTAPQPSNRTVTYTYNALGQKITAGYGGMTITYDYFANGWLKDVKKGANTIASYTYDSSGNRTRVDFGNGTYQTFDYDTDPRYRLASIDYAYGCDGDEDIEVRGTLDLTRDNAGNPLTWGNDDYKKTYTYDDNNRLATAALPGNSTARYTYDWVGNRLGTGITYNAADQMTASPGKSYTYDGNGNMLTGTMAFSYSPTNLVTEAGSTDMAWDSMGNRVSFTTSGSATYQFVYDPSAGIPAVLEEVTPGGSVYYIRDPRGMLLARITGTGESQTTTYYHFDELGSTLFLTDPDGILTDKYTYDAWGNVTSHVGGTNQPYQFVGQLGYYNHYQENGFKLLQLGVRLYDPEMGRFMQIDSAGDGSNLYAYTGDNPMFYVDPNGKARSTGGENRRDSLYKSCYNKCMTCKYTKLLTDDLVKFRDLSVQINGAMGVAGFMVGCFCPLAGVPIGLLGTPIDKAVEENLSNKYRRSACSQYCDIRSKNGHSFQFHPGFANWFDSYFRPAAICQYFSNLAKQKPPCVYEKGQWWYCD